MVEDNSSIPDPTFKLHKESNNMSEVRNKKNSRLELESAMNCMSDALFITDVSGNFIEYNEAFARYHRFKNKEECLKKLPEYGQYFKAYTLTDELIPFESWPINRALSGEFGENYQIKVQRTDIGEIWIGSYNFSPISEPDGMIIGAIMSCRDITKFKDDVLKLKLSEIVYQNSSQGILVTDKFENILSVNPAVTEITGYTEEELIGKTPRIFRSDFHDATFHFDFKQSLKLNGKYHGVFWNKHKMGHLYPVLMTINQTFSDLGEVENYVAMFSDYAVQVKEEKERILKEENLRKTLVREVHHRIKNNLQGVSGILRNFSQQHPEFFEPTAKAISQVQNIAIIHGLQGRSPMTNVRLCELINEIVINNNKLWNANIFVDIPLKRQSYLIAESEAVPIALILNELLSNAIKHGGSTKKVDIKIRREPLIELIKFKITITNSGYISPDINLKHTSGISTGLQLISSLLPKKGAYLTWEQCEDNVVFQLDLESPIITLEQEEKELQ